MKRLALLLALSACTPSTTLNTLTAVDGDTVREAGVSGPAARIRLARIDAPELPGHCRAGRVCQPGDPWLARSTLQRIITTQCPCHLGPSRSDYYNRRLAELYTAGGSNVSDLMLASGTVGLYKRGTSRAAKRF